MTNSPRVRALDGRHGTRRYSNDRHRHRRQDSSRHSTAPRKAGTPRRTHSPRRLFAVTVAVAAGAALLAGCSDASETTCGDFLGQSTNDQKSTTTELLEDRGTSNPPAMLLAAAQGSLAGYCNVEGDDASLGDAMDAFSKTLDDIGATTGPEQPGD